ETSGGLNVGDPVVMMGFDVGRITLIHALPPGDNRNVQVEFEVRDPYFRYVWRDGSVVKVNAADFLGKRQIEITRGTNGPAISVTQPIEIFTNLDDLKQLVMTTTNQWQLSQDILDENSNIVFSAYAMLNEERLQRISELTHEPVYAFNNTAPTKNYVVAVWRRRAHHYEPITPGRENAWLPALESPAVTERLQKVVDQVQAALPNFLALTNQLQALLQNGANAASNVSALAVSAKPITTNANSLIMNLDTNVTATLISLADITSSLNAQVQANSNILSGISKAVTDSDTFVQGLKHHWLLRSAFKKENEAAAKALEGAKTNAPPPKR
ncbi:MAG TPA: MlaD family protein, partial [Candidatus Baltobacteraceae bacterium]|nr:MlaD family protein [Candidatus Baltobacteraceae bacterium]